MHSIGLKLRSEREKQKRTVSDLANATCISSMYLRAIEADDVKVLPGFFFYKSFVKQYAIILGLDPDVVCQGIEQMDPGDDSDPLPALSVSYQVPKREDSRTIFARHPRIWSAVAALCMLIASSMVYSWWHNRREAKEEAQVRAAVVPPAAEAAKPPEVVAQPVSTQPVASNESAGEAATIELNQNGSPDHVVLSAREKTWVRVKSRDGKTLFSGVLAPAETKAVEIADNTKLTTGNAAGLEVMLNGKPLGPLGARGEVRTIVFSQGGAQIIAGRL